LFVIRRRHGRLGLQDIFQERRLAAEGGLLLA
jgi:hypothetical protein